MNKECREEELRDAAKCALCGKGFGHTGLPLFWRVRIQRFGLNAAAANRQQGLAMILGGNGRLALVMGADEVMAREIEGFEFTVCETCACETSLPVAALAEAASPKSDTDEDAGDGGEG